MSTDSMKSHRSFRQLLVSDPKSKPTVAGFLPALVWMGSCSTIVLGSNRVWNTDMNTVAWLAALVAGAIAIYVLIAWIVVTQPVERQGFYGIGVSSIAILAINGAAGLRQSKSLDAGDVVAHLLVSAIAATASAILIRRATPARIQSEASSV